MRFVAMPLAVALATGCSAKEPKADPKGGSDSAMRLEKRFHEADLVAVARPTALQPSPNAWSGTLATFQGVEYEVIRSLKGDAIEAKQSIVVLHPLVAKSATADEANPRLRSSAFDRGKTYVVFIRTDGDKLYGTDANDGIVEATPDVIEALERLATR